MILRTLYMAVFWIGVAVVSFCAVADGYWRYRLEPNAGRNSNKFFIATVVGLLLLSGWIWLGKALDLWR